MQEDFLHYIYKHKKFETSNLETTDGQSIIIDQLGQHNVNSGPDFFNAHVRISDQLWAGNVEIHVKSSDWYVHHHEKDKAYDNVILHVVWEHDTEIFRQDNSEIPTLELKQYTDVSILQNYTNLMKSKSWINCEADFPTIDTFLLDHWLERLYIERLERKSNEIQQLLKSSQNDWEAVLFKMLAKSFGLKINGASFLSLTNSFEFAIIRKLQNESLDLEALFFGQADLLNEDHQDIYYLELQKRYQFLKQKFSLHNEGVLPLQFFRLRPSNFPTIRLAQLAVLYHKETSLFSKVINLKTIAEFYTLFKIEASDFWKNHYTFSKVSKASKKRLTKSFIDLLLINTIIPLQFSYAKANGKTIDVEIIKLIKSITLERNSITKAFLKLKPIEKSALISQSLIQLKAEYCDKNKCLQCAIGNSLIANTN